ncbi:hypothetical protein KR044_007046, partial [Drosophila immigrans]
EELDRRYELLMPMEAEVDPAFCRDTFLKKLFKEVDLPEHEKIPSESSSNESLSDDTFYTWPSVYSDVMSLSSIMNSSIRLKFAPSRRLDNTRPTLYSSSLLYGLTSGHVADQYEELLQSLKRASLYFMFSRAINRLRIMGRIAEDEEGGGGVELPHDLFGWSLEGFLKRCALPDSVYLDVLQMKHTEKTVNWAKFSADIKEIIRFYKFFYTQTFLDKGPKSMMSTIWDQEQLLEVENELDKALTSTLRTFDNVIVNSRKVADSWWGRYRAKLVKICKLRHMEVTMKIPIKWRYVRDSLAAMTEMQIIKDREPVEALRKQREELEMEIQDNQISSQQGMLVYSLLIGDYEDRLTSFNNKLNNDAAEWDDKILLSTIQLGKLKDEIKHKQEEIEFMQRRVQEVQELIGTETEALVE